MSDYQQPDQPQPQPGQPAPGYYQPYQQPYGYPYPPPRPTNGLAIAAMVVGIVGVCNPIGIIGLILGYVSRRQIRERGEQGDGFAITGIVLGWIAVAGTIFWIIYVIVMFATMGAVYNQMEDNYPSYDPTDLSTVLAALS